MRPEHGSDVASHASHEVVHALPAMAATIERVEPNFFAAWLSILFLPRRYGPHVAGGSLSRALAAHVLSLATAMLVLLSPMILSKGPDRHTWYAIRESLASELLHTAARFSTSDNQALYAALVLAALPILQLLVIVTATLAMPWVACGDRMRSVWRRSVRLANWGTVVLVPVAAVTVVAREWIADLRGQPLTYWITMTCLIAPMVFLFVRLLVVGGSVYAGPASSPPCVPREPPRCDDCGYVLLGLPFDTRCPECGTAVRDSLPGGRRKPTPWHDGRLRFGALPRLLRLHWSVLKGNDAFRYVPVYDQMAAARTFWWTGYVLMIAVVLALTSLVSVLIPPESSLSGQLGLIGIGMAAGVFVVHMMFMLPLSLWARVRYGIRDCRVAAVIGWHGLPLFWPIPLTSLFWILAAEYPGNAWLNQALPAIHWQGFRFSGNEYVATTLGCISLGWLLVAWLRLNAAVRAVRFANA